MTTPTFGHQNLINYACIANRTNKKLENYNPVHAGEKVAMDKIGNNLDYYQDIATDAEMMYNAEANLFIFKGSDSKQDWKQNFSFLPMEYNGMKFHRGFLEQFKALEPILKEQITKETQVTFTGHSLGGAIAEIASWHFHKLGYNVRMVTFGCPRSGLKELKTYYNNSTIDSFTYIEGNDPVPLLPKRPFRHPERHRVLMQDGNFLTMDEKFNWKYFAYRINFISRFVAWTKKKPSEWHDSNRYRKSIETYMSKKRL